MVASGRAKKARKHVFQNQGAIEDLPPAQQRYIEKKIVRIMNSIERDTSAPTAPDYRAFPCQKLTGKFALLPIDAQPVCKDDGLWYLDDELVISQHYKAKMKRANKQPRTAVVNEDGSASDIGAMEPQVLGE